MMALMSSISALTPLRSTAVLVLLLAARAGAQLPVLSVQQVGGGIVLSWPASASGFMLQTTEDPSVPASWANVAGTYLPQGANLNWTNTFPAGKRFFRLAQNGPLPVPTNALTGSIASMGTPWVVTTDANAPGSPVVPGTAVGTVPKIITTANDDGSLDVAWISTASPPRIVITHIVPDNTSYKAAWHLRPPTLAYLGGFARDAAGAMFYLTTVAEDLTTQPQPKLLHRPNIAHLVKLSPLGAEIFRTDLRTNFEWAGAEPLYSPMTWGTSQLAVGDGRVVMTMSCNTEFDPPVNSRHQWHISLGADAGTGALNLYKPAFGHCWDHRLIFHAGKFINTSLGDAGLRGIGVADVVNSWHKVAFAIKGGDSTTVPFYQNVFTRLGDLAPGQAGYGLLFTTEKTNTYSGGTSPVISARNVAFAHVRSDFAEAATNSTNQYDVAIVDTNTGNPAAQAFDIPIKDYWGTTYAGKNKGLVWLTNYTNRSTENAERPHLVSLGDGRFIALWERWTLTAYADTLGAVIDEYGNVVKAPRSIGSTVRLHRQDSPVRFGTKAAWTVGESGPAKLVFYTLDAELVLKRTVIQ